jgi:hypothetical protein
MNEQRTTATNDMTTDRRYERHHHRTGGILGGLILLALGILLFLANQSIIGWDIWWQYFLVGLGAAFLIDCAVRYFWNHQSFMQGRLIAGIILAGIGIAFLAGISMLWPIIIIIVGLVVLIGGLVRRH